MREEKSRFYFLVCSRSSLFMSTNSENPCKIMLELLTLSFPLWIVMMVSKIFPIRAAELPS